jgi:membrane-associated protease RseP (regulator of RpoE activity)
VSSNLPELADVSSRPGKPEALSNFFRRNPLRNEWLIAGILFCLTLICTSFAGMFYSIGDIGFAAALRIFLRKPEIILQGLSFSIPLISILLAHELGHFFACRLYGMNCTPPFFIPVPVSITGTLGAFIRIKSPFLNKRALFDIGVAGPLAGFTFVLPLLCLGISSSRLMPKGAFPPGGLIFGEPLIFRCVGAFLLGNSPDRHGYPLSNCHIGNMIAHPIAMAAWVGLLATSLNLLPIWQLDGGHIAYAMLGRIRQKQLSIAGLAFLMLLTLWGWRTPSYLFFALLLLIVGWRVRFYHPRTLLEEEPLGRVRIIVGLLALLILVISFIPVPVSFG